MLSQPVVNVSKLGTLTGLTSRVDEGVSIFLGIPYAKPPIEELRWQPPVAYGAFGQRNATAYGDICVQDVTPTSTFSMSEDCLFLNVAAPASSSSPLLPVLVWIHGGAYTSGSSNLYPADQLVSHSNRSVVVVTMNYRLNIFGFLGGKDVAARSADGGSGNFGIADQRMAMRWVHDNIQAFGGDPQHVTIFGESAGGNSVLNHITAQQSFSLYDKAIIESGLYNEGAFAFEIAQDLFSVIADEAQCAHAKNVMICLQSMSAKELLESSNNALHRINAETNYSLIWSPIVDGVERTEDPKTIIEKGRHNTQVPLIIGSNRDEMAFWTIDPSVISYEATEIDFDGYMRKSNVSDGEIEELKQIYGPGTTTYEYPKDEGSFSGWWWAVTRSVTGSFSHPSLSPRHHLTTPL